MRKAFTLVEMLIVVVVIVTLMTITFRLGAVNESSAIRNKTVSRIQRLENCLSGYFAAFGSYPPVALHGSRNPYLVVSSKGIQNLDGEENEDIFSWNPDTFRRGSSTTEEQKAWEQVKAACKAQPVGCEYPFPDGFNELVLSWSDHLRDEVAASDNATEEQQRVFAAGFDDGVSQNVGRHRQYRDRTDWREIQLFKFGLMSFFLPRYLIMMNAAEESIYDDYEQWTGNNTMPADPLTGQKFSSWREVRRNAFSGTKTDYYRIANIPSQAVCARWMPNLEKIVSTQHSTLKVFGVELRDADDIGFNLNMPVYSPGGFDEDSTSSQYILDSCTIKDGWGNEFYYYSPAPYQTYQLWSSGPNGRTFPPWISREDLDSNANKCVGAWTEDDIMSMSH
ncbi:MAG: prepilin-type N-terminal cleavage/methylation domain-containing protein [Kiritimatiellae bacterium]|jgi:prepilin-type N-terminal cleavage/methylation domain-containing protein|nr:prepilin-type N-terminal cleavage/methylation domain-containing protein [Kiritimatiellia bacterium]